MLITKDKVFAYAKSVTPDLAATIRDVPNWMTDPVKMKQVTALRRQRARETMEKKEGTAADARSAKIKLEANDAFRKGDYKKAFILYSVCCEKSDDEPVYFLNRAAAALKLGLYSQALDDASYAIEAGFNIPKALFRSAQAQRFLGDFDAAHESITMALCIIGPGEDGHGDDPALMKELNEVRRLQDLGPEAQEAWLSQQESKTVDDVFGSGELEKLVEAELAQQD